MLGVFKERKQWIYLERYWPAQGWVIFDSLIRGQAFREENIFFERKKIDRKKGMYRYTYMFVSRIVAAAAFFCKCWNILGMQYCMLQGALLFVTCVWSWGSFCVFGVVFFRFFFPFIVWSRLAAMRLLLRLGTILIMFLYFYSCKVVQIDFSILLYRSFCFKYVVQNKSNELDAI